MVAFLLALLGISAEQQRAPVYSYLMDNVVQRVGTYTYTPDHEGYQILYCLAYPHTIILQCVVHTPADRLVLIEVVATEYRT